MFKSIYRINAESTYLLTTTLPQEVVDENTRSNMPTARTQSSGMSGYRQAGNRGQFKSGSEVEQYGYYGYYDEDEFDLDYESAGVPLLNKAGQKLAKSLSGNSGNIKKPPIIDHIKHGSVDKLDSGKVGLRGKTRNSGGKSPDEFILTRKGYVPDVGDVDLPVQFIGSKTQSQYIMRGKNSDAGSIMPIKRNVNNLAYDPRLPRNTNPALKENTISKLKFTPNDSDKVREYKLRKMLEYTGADNKTINKIISLVRKQNKNQSDTFLNDLFIKIRNDLHYIHEVNDYHIANQANKFNAGSRASKKFEKAMAKDIMTKNRFKRYNKANKEAGIINEPYFKGKYVNKYHKYDE